MFVLFRSSLMCLGLFAAVDVALAQPATAEKPVTKTHPVTIANGALAMSAPGEWSVKKPRTRIVAHEFAIPAAEGDAAGGRLTIMGAGGSIQANVDRWKGQFSAPDKKRTNSITKKEIAGQQVHLVDLSGTFQDRPGGPFGPAVERKGYRMLAAIVETDAKGNYFVKLYGPAKTIAQAESQFRGFIESLQATK